MRKLLIGALIPMGLACTAIAFAETAPEDAAKYRQSIMKALSGHNGAISLIVRGKAGSADNLASHVDAIAAMSTEMGDLFAAGSDLEDDRSLPAIWDDAEAFAAAVADYEAAAKAFAAAGESGDVEAVAAAQKELGAACKACHEDYRAED